MSLAGISSRISLLQFFESYNKLLTMGLPNGYRGYMSRSMQGIGMDLTLVGALSSSPSYVPCFGSRIHVLCEAHSRTVIAYIVSATWPCCG
jgi:hypothetical protein